VELCTSETSLFICVVVQDEKPTPGYITVGPRKSSISGPSGSLEGQLQALKYENDRLKIALATRYWKD
jgi:hypothetical protein